MISRYVTIILIILVMIFYQYYFVKRHGLWIDKDFPIDYDDSLVWKVKYLSFNLLHGSHVKFPKNSKMIGLFEGVRMLDIYDYKLRHINHFFNPRLIVLEEGFDVFAGVKYHIMLRYREEDEDILETTTYLELEYDENKQLPGSVYEINPLSYYDESFYKDENKEFMEQIIQEMEEKDYELENIETSSIRRSFPSNMLINEINICLESDISIVIMVTNKKKTLDVEFHSIEFESDEKRFIWNPTGDENFSFLVLDEGEDVEISIKEYLYCEQSKILPITVMKFVPV